MTKIYSSKAARARLDEVQREHEHEPFGAQVAAITRAVNELAEPMRRAIHEAREGDE